MTEHDVSLLALHTAKMNWLFRKGFWTILLSVLAHAVLPAPIQWFAELGAGIGFGMWVASASLCFSDWRKDEKEKDKKDS